MYESQCDTTMHPN